MTGRPCSICTHVCRSEIEVAIAGPASLRATGTAFGMSAQALIRHRDQHMVPAAVSERPIVTRDPSWETSSNRPQPGQRCERCGGSEWWEVQFWGIGGCLQCVPKRRPTASMREFNTISDDIGYAAAGSHKTEAV